jgi:microcystin-dependent protein
VFSTTTNGDSIDPSDAFISTTLDAEGKPFSAYAANIEAKRVKMSSKAITSTGESTKASSVQPFIALNYIISCEGARFISENYLAEIRIFTCGTSYLPGDWIPCDGRLLPINSSTMDLFKILLTQYGGDGRNNFGVPDLRGKAPICGVAGDPSYSFGMKMGSMTTALSYANMPPHDHDVRVVKADKDVKANKATADGNVLGVISIEKSGHYTQKPVGNLSTMDMTTLGNIGISKPIDNTQPVLGVVFAIATKGIFPPKS